MKKNISALLISSIIWLGCEDKINDQTCTGLLENDKLILCEGSFNNNNASLWSFHPDRQNSEMIHYEELGDVAQSMITYEDKLYTVLNNSHKIEIYDLGPELCYNNTLVLDNSSPRYFAANGSMGYVSTWNLESILVINLNTLNVSDTIHLPGKPEDLIINDNILYTAIPYTNQFSDTNLVIGISLNNHEIISEYSVVDGPNDLEIHNNQLYVSGSVTTIYPSNNTGISRINLNTDVILTLTNEENTNIKNGLSIINGSVFRTSSEGLIPVRNDLSLDIENTILGGTNISFASADDNYIYFTETDYIAPDTVRVTTLTGDFINEFIVGIAPKKFISLNN